MKITVRKNNELNCDIQDIPEGEAAIDRNGTVWINTGLEHMVSIHPTHGIHVMQKRNVRKHTVMRDNGVKPFIGTISITGRPW